MAEIERGQANANYALKMQKAPVQVTRTKGPRYTPVSKRQDKPDGIAWILKNHPEVSDGAIGKLIGTTRNTIGAIRDRSHWSCAAISATRAAPSSPSPSCSAWFSASCLAFSRPGGCRNCR